MAKLKLRPVEHGKDKNRYCGPSVISAVTKLTTGEAARLIRLQSGRRSVIGTSTSNVRRALKSCNVQMTFVPAPTGSRYGRSSGVTLARWLKLTHATRANRIFLITAGHHWQLVSGNRYVCGRTGEIVSIRDKKVKRRARVADVYELTSDGVTKPDIDVSKPKDPNAKTRAEAHRLAKKWGIEIEVFRGETFKNVWPPEKIKEDPYEGEHCTHTWTEVLYMVRSYSGILELQNS